MLPRYRQTRRRSFGDGTTILVQIRRDLREPVRVGTPVPHEPAQGVGRLDDEIPLVPGRAADVPATGPETIAEALANSCGGDDAGGVAAPKRKVEEGGKTVEERLHAPREAASRARRCWPARRAL
jgi:hypothetical protein